MSTPSKEEWYKGYLIYVVVLEEPPGGNYNTKRFKSVTSIFKNEKKLEYPPFSKEYSADSDEAIWRAMRLAKAHINRQISPGLGSLGKFG